MHDLMLDGVRVTYHVHGTGPVCLVYPGGPGFDWRYLRLPMLEEHLTTVYVEPPGSGSSGLLADGDYARQRALRPPRGTGRLPELRPGLCS